MGSYKMSIGFINFDFLIDAGPVIRANLFHGGLQDIAVIENKF